MHEKKIIRQISLNQCWWNNKPHKSQTLNTCEQGLFVPRRLPSAWSLWGWGKASGRDVCGGMRDTSTISFFLTSDVRFRKYLRPRGKLKRSWIIMNNKKPLLVFVLPGFSSRFKKNTQPGAARRAKEKYYDPKIDYFCNNPATTTLSQSSALCLPASWHRCVNMCMCMWVNT